MHFIQLLLALPQELLLCITDFLDPADTACLALCSKELSSRLPKAVLWAKIITRRKSCCPCLSQARSERWGDDFLCRIAQTFPTHFFCRYCHALHKVETWLTPQIEEYIRNRQCRDGRRSLLCGKAASDGQLTWIFSLIVPSVPLSFHLLAFRMVQLAMIRSRHGKPYGIPLHWLSSIEVRTSFSGVPSPTSLVLQTTEPLVVAASCHLRIQQWILFAHNQPLLGYVDIFSEVYLQYRLCSCPPHRSSSADDTDCQDLFECRMQHKQATCGLCSRYVECEACESSLQLRSYVLDDGRAAWVITRWLDIGDGTDENDHKWRRHRERRMDSYRLVKERKPSAEARQAFEAASARSVDKLTIDNAMLLQDNYYEKALTEDSPRMWYAPIRGTGPDSTWPLGWRQRLLS